MFILTTLGLLSRVSVKPPQNRFRKTGTSLPRLKAKIRDLLLRVTETRQHQKHCETLDTALKCSGPLSSL